MRETTVGYDQDSVYTCGNCQKMNQMFILKRMQKDVIGSSEHMSQQEEGIAEIIHNSKEITKMEIQREK